YLPRGFASLGRRLVYTIGIVILLSLSALLLIIFGGITERLIALFAVGAFGAFTMSQAGMVVHWRKQKGNRGARASLCINALGAVATSAALVIIIVAKFSEGAWITLLIIPGLVMIFRRIHRHYDCLAREIAEAPSLQLWKVHPLTLVIPIEGWNRLSE